MTTPTSEKENLSVKGLKYKHANGVEFNVSAEFGKDEITLVATTPKSKDTITFDARTLLPKKERLAVYQDRAGMPDPLMDTTEFTIEETKAGDMSLIRPRGTPVLRHRMVKNTFSHETLGGILDFEKTSYGKSHAPTYEMLDQAISKLPTGFEASEIRNRFNATAASIGFGDYTNKLAQVGGS